MEGFPYNSFQQNQARNIAEYTLRAKMEVMIKDAAGAGLEKEAPRRGPRFDR